MPTNETDASPRPPAGADARARVDDFNVNHDAADLVRYRGHWVAWSRDGRKVLAASPDPYELCALVDAAGLSPDDYVFGAIGAEW
jgi:hypothetical protein